MSVSEIGRDLPPQTQPDIGSRNLGNDQIKNDAGGYVNQVECLKQLQRFAIIGCEKGTYYASEEKLEVKNVESLDKLIASGKGLDAVNLLKEISLNRRNVKQGALLYAYAILCRCNNSEVKQAAYKEINNLCRIPTHLFMFVNFCEKVSAGSGWGRAHKRAVGEWYLQFNEKPERLVYLITKYKMREKWSHKDVVRLSHTHVDMEDKSPMAFLLRYITKGFDKAKQYYLEEENEATVKIANLVKIYEEASRCMVADQLCQYISTHKLAHEHCPTEMLREKSVWAALLPHMPDEAMLRNLGRMSNLGMFETNGQDEQMVLQKIESLNPGLPSGEQSQGNTEESGRRLMHPYKILIAKVTYEAGHGDKGKLTWTPNEKIVKALETAFYKAFKAVRRTGKTYYLAVDVSGSMTSPVIGCSNISCSMAAATMMMVTARREQNTIIKGFSQKMTDLGINMSDTLQEVMTKVGKVTMGSTDCAQPMIDAMDMKRRDIDVFVIYTDNETWYGQVHPSEALRQYRQYASNRDVKLIVCGMAANNFTIADTGDLNMLDICGFDSEAPQVISQFTEGKL